MKDIRYRKKNRGDQVVKSSKNSPFISTGFYLHFLVGFIVIFSFGWIVMSFVHPYYNPDLDLSGTYFLALNSVFSAWNAYRIAA